MSGGFADDGIIGDGESHSVDSHIRWGNIKLFRIHDPFADPADNRENFHITVVIDSRFITGGKVEWIHHVHIGKVCSCSFVCHIDRMIQRQIPDRKGLKFCIAGTDTPELFMIDL